jgi:hypothetical protein
LAWRDIIPRDENFKVRERLYPHIEVNNIYIVDSQQLKGQRRPQQIFSDIYIVDSQRLKCQHSRYRMSGTPDSANLFTFKFPDFPAPFFRLTSLHDTVATGD